MTSMHEAQLTDGQLDDVNGGILPIVVGFGIGLAFTVITGTAKNACAPTNAEDQKVCRDAERL